MRYGQTAEYKHEWYIANKERMTQKSKEWQEANPEKKALSARRHHLKKNYDMTLEQYDDLLLAQGGGCSICGEGCSLHVYLSVDHCHDTGVIRGLLCAKCNNALGLFKNDPDLLRNAIDYLEWPAC